MNRKEIEGRVKLKKGRLYQINSKTKGGVTRIGNRDPNTGLYQAIRTDGVQPGIKTFNTSVSENQVVRYTPATQNIASLDWRNHRSAEPSSSESVDIIKPVVLYSQLNLEESAVSIVYRVTVPDTPTECTCPTWNRVGNRCIQVCNSSGTYASLEQCLLAPAPPWPPPEGQDGRGGYWVLYVGHKQSTAYVGNGYSYSAGGWTGGLFYEASEFFGNCSNTSLLDVDNRAQAAYVLASPGDFPNHYLTTEFWYYYDLPMLPQPSASTYPGGTLTFMKNAITTTGLRYCDANGWFVWADYNLDIYFSSTNTWQSGNPGSAYALCLVGKYVPAESFTDGNPPSPPSTIEGFDVSGVTLIHNRGNFECGGGGDTPAEEPPEEKDCYRYYLGGSKSPPLLLHQINITDPHTFYISTIALEKKEDESISTQEIINFLLGQHSDGSWCKLLNIQANGQQISKTIYDKPAIPDKDPKDWRYSLLDYTPPPPSSGDPLVDTYRLLTSYNLIERAKESVYHLFNFDSSQSVDGVSFSTLIKTTSIENKAIIQYSLQERNTTVGKNVIIPKVHSLSNSLAQIVACSAYIKIQAEYFLAGAVASQSPLSLNKYTEGDYQLILSTVSKQFLATVKSLLGKKAFSKIDQFSVSPALEITKTEELDTPKLPESNESNPENSFTQTYDYPFPDPATPCLKELILEPFKNLLTGTKLVVVDPSQTLTDENGVSLGKLTDALKTLPSDRSVNIKYKVHTLSEEEDTCTIGEGTEKQIKLFGLGLENDNDIIQFTKVRDVVIAMWRQRR